MSMSIKASPDGTYGEILVNGAVVAKLPVTGNAVIPGLVGTVSQSGGVPTGAVVERGSNANGEYVRYADGTQICTSGQLDVAVNQPAGSLFSSSDSNVWTLPAPFINSAYIVTGGVVGNVQSHWFSGRSLTGTQATVGGWSTGSYSDRPIKAVAIGRWF